MQAWQNRFAEYSTDTAFNMSLSKSQVALVSALKDGSWRAWYSTGYRNGFFMAFMALERRGLAERNDDRNANAPETWRYRLTPAGELVFDLLIMAGILVKNELPAQAAA